MSYPLEPGPGPWFFCLRHAVGPGAVGIVMVGELDIAAAADARDVISRAQAAAPEVICDLHDVSFIDPCGLRVLVDAAARARRHNARLTLANPSAAVRRLTELVGVDMTLRAKAVPSASAPRPDSPRTTPGCTRVPPPSRAAKPPKQPRGPLTTKSTPLIVRSSRRAARQDRRR